MVRVRVGVCLVEDDRILLAEHVKSGHRHWLLPGGGVEPGETMAETAAREMLEETGFTVKTGRLLIVCEAIEARGRHLVNMVFSATRLHGSLRVGRDGTLEEVAWRGREELEGLDMHPPIASAVLACWDEGFEGPVKVLGNVWRPEH
jgi:8-oxo-dGTP diphosphatase